MMDDDTLSRGTDPTTPYLTSNTDADRILGLLAEYTGKLKALLSDARINRAKWGSVSVTLFVVAGIGISLFLAPIWSSSGVSYYNPYELSAFLFCILAAVFAGLAAFFRARTLSSDVLLSLSEVAGGLERLVGLASQYTEYGRLAFSKKLEFELRLAEAEAALQSHAVLVLKGKTRRPKAPRP